MSKNKITENELKEELEEIFGNVDITKNIIKMDKNRIRTKLVLSGGGSKGIAHLGGLYALEKMNLLKNIKIYVGTSVGAIISFFLNIGYSPLELYEILKGIDFDKLTELNFTNFIKKYGFDTGDRILIVLKKFLIDKNINVDITFKELYQLTKKELIVTSVCVNDKHTYYMSHKTFPNMKVITAVRMSISIPIYFTPILHENKMFIDGACIDNYPIHLFNDDLDDVIGLFLADNRNLTTQINDIETYLSNMMQCIFEGLACNATKGYESCTIKINVKKINGLNLKLTNSMKNYLFDEGYKTVINRFQ